ncbi:hypothetical protein M3Y99_00035000 [Aphelenchoides fujianensis]|nr:hypothetical protein M3Y99_00035000 [Aphelenchoides fujianensis]
MEIRRPGDRRTLYCRASQNRVVPGECFLTVGKDGTPKPATCGREEKKNSASSATWSAKEPIGIPVISKYPNTNRNCIRYFSYNTRQEEGARSRWTLWRSSQCAMDEIALEVHCGFPTNG